MSYRVIIPKPVSRKIGACGLTRTLVVRLLTTLRHQLENDADYYRSDRAHEDPDVLFQYSIPLLEGGDWHVFRFVVNDAQAADILFVEGVGYRVIHMS